MTIDKTLTPGLYLDHSERDNDFLDLYDVSTKGNVTLVALIHSDYLDLILEATSELNKEGPTKLEPFLVPSNEN